MTWKENEEAFLPRKLIQSISMQIRERDVFILNKDKVTARAMLSNIRKILIVHQYVTAEKSAAACQAAAIAGACFH
jgi:hypothetical protein